MEVLCYALASALLVLTGAVVILCSSLLLILGVLWQYQGIAAARAAAVLR